MPYIPTLQSALSLYVVDIIYKDIEYGYCIYYTYTKTVLLPTKKKPIE